MIICLYFLFPPGSVLEGCIAAGVRTEGWDELGDWDRHIHTTDVVDKQILELMRTYCKAQGTRLNTLWRPEGEGNLKKTGSMYAWSWFTLLYSRIQHSIVNATIL